MRTIESKEPELISSYRGYDIYKLPDGSFNKSSSTKNGSPVFYGGGYNLAWSVKVAIDEELRP